MIRLLIIDDEKAIRDAIRISLMGEEYQFLEADNLEEGYQLITRQQPDVVILDVHFPNMQTCHSLLKRLQEEKIELPIIILSGAASANEAVDAIRLGAFDFVQKPVSAEKLEVSIIRALESSKMKDSLNTITHTNNSSHDLIGDSNAIKGVKSQINQFAQKDIKVLITGETGTGKEVIAHHIWRQSKRANEPFIIVNSAAIPETLIESELFGHTKGAFTGASSNQIGKIEMADGGTLFLDEIGELSEQAQSKLLRFLENGEVQRVGSKKVQTCDVRLIAATSRDPEQEVENGRLRKDLFFRLNVGRIVLPPLRERGEDVILIMNHFICSLCSKHNEPIKKITQEARTKLTSYNWPGNIRELRNIAERIVLLPEKEISEESIKSLLPHSNPLPSGNTNEWLPESIDEVISLKDLKKQVERTYIISVLKLTDGSVSKAAKVLGLARGYLYQKITELEISLP